MIDQEGIKSLEKGADNIRLTGSEGASSPAQEIIKAGIPKDMTMDQKVDAHCCLECHNMDLSDWSKGNRKCPKCLGKMEIDKDGEILCWD